jgi:hypothetical protein
MPQKRHLAIVGALLITCPVSALSGDALNPTHLPVGDGKISTTPKVGYVMRCGIGPGNGGGALVAGPWIRTDGTFDLTAKVNVNGSVNWTSSLELTSTSNTRRLSGNGLPNHPTGTYPIATTDAAYRYDRNPNSIRPQTLGYNLPSNPVVAATPSCLRPGAIAVMLTGAVVFDGLDAMNRDAVAYEVQDTCQGHPERTGAYHYHNLTSCITDSGTGHSSLLGYALDGFGLYGQRGQDGKQMTNTDLDECHGHTHEIQWDGKNVVMYHYHATLEYPYMMGCFKGTPTR